MLLYEQADIIRVSYDEAASLLIHEWINYDPEDQEKHVLEALEFIFQAFQSHPVNKVLVLADKTKGCFSPKVQDFISDVQFPRLLKDTNLRFVATVLDKSQISATYTEMWEAELTTLEAFVTRDFASEKEARDWLAQVPSR